jgi:hypothetical protein
MAVGYSVSSDSMYPAVRYAGRLVTDSAGTLEQGEATFFAGSGAQSGAGGAWGTHSSMTVDPIDDCTFWYTNMYYETTGSSWRTRIGSFAFPECLSSAFIQVSLGPAPKAQYLIPAGGRLVAAYPGEFNGPVHVVSTNGIDILPSERGIYGSSFSETMGTPDSQLTTEYLFTWYDNIYMQTWIAVGAPASNAQTALVDIYIGPDKMNVDAYEIAPGGQIVEAYAGAFNGPVRVVSTNGQKILPSERGIYGNSFSETVGTPASQLTTDYWFTWYDNIYMQTWIAVGAPASNAETALVDIYIGPDKMNVDAYEIAPGNQIVEAYAGAFNGPVRVVSTNGQKILPSERGIYGSSFSETRGTPDAALTDHYWFTWYDNIYMQTWMAISAP